MTVEFDTFYLVTGYVPNSGDGLKRLVLFFNSITFIFLTQLFLSIFQSSEWILVQLIFLCLNLVLQSDRMGSSSQQLFESMYYSIPSMNTIRLN